MFLRSYLLAIVVILTSIPAGFSKTYNAQDETMLQCIWARIKTLPAQERGKVGLVLGGGGARGLAHIGVLKVISEERLPVDLLVGTSVGAIVGSLYAAGMPIKDLEKVGENIGWNQLSDISTANIVKLFVAYKLLSSKKMEDYLNKHIGNLRFDELPIQFACVAADLKTGERIILREGKLAPAVRASATIPGAFTPVEYRHRLLVDGGIVDNVPTDIAKLLGANIIIAVPIQADFSNYNISNVLFILNQAIYIQGEVITQEKLDMADAVIKPRVSHVMALDLGKSKICIEAGVVAARRALPELKRIITKKSFKKYVENLINKR